MWLRPAQRSTTARRATSALARSDTAVIVGVSSHGYGDLQQRRPRTINAYSMSGMASCNTANRVSYVFDLRGASFAVDTACSSTLTAVHQACQEVRSGRSALALAGGVNVLLNPWESIGFAQASMLSRTGRCHVFGPRSWPPGRETSAASGNVRPVLPDGAAARRCRMRSA
ncbi:MAG: hypothetical protein HOY79_49280 [Streptomyces sp.]|nr:hypothetical protein [Streptomyces sp.]